MPVRIASALVVSDGGVDAFAEAASRVALGLGGAPVDLAVVFAGAMNLDHADEGIAAVHERLNPETLAGCGAQGVVGDGRELEDGGVVVWGASLPEAELESFRLDVTPAGESSVAVSGLPDLDLADGALLFADPYSFPVDPLLRQLNEDTPGLPIVGGLTSAGGGPHGAALLHDQEVVGDGAVGVALAGVDLRALVSQGARPIGPEMTITAAEGNVIQELASKPALARLKAAIAELGPEDSALAARGLLLGIVIDENKPDYGRGDFLIRALLGVDEESGTISVGERVRVGQTVRMQVRDAGSADEDLRLALAREASELGGPPAGALLFTCNGRGSNMFTTPDHDASVLQRTFAGAPSAGFFCAGEIGPVGQRNFLHGFTATMAVFAG